MNATELRRLVERKTETVQVLEELLEQEDTLLVELERQLEEMEGAGPGRAPCAKERRKTSADETGAAIRPADSRTSSERRGRLA